MAFEIIGYRHANRNEGTYYENISEGRTFNTREEAQEYLRQAVGVKTSGGQYQPFENKLIQRLARRMGYEESGADIRETESTSQKTYTRGPLSSSEIMDRRESRDRLERRQAGISREEEKLLVNLDKAERSGDISKQSANELRSNIVNRDELAAYATARRTENTRNEIATGLFNRQAELSEQRIMGSPTSTSAGQLIKLLPDEFRTPENLKNIALFQQERSAPPIFGAGTEGVLRAEEITGYSYRPSPYNIYTSLTPAQSKNLERTQKVEALFGASAARFYGEATTTGVSRFKENLLPAGGFGALRALLPRTAGAVGVATTIFSIKGIQKDFTEKGFAGGLGANLPTLFLFAGAERAGAGARAAPGLVKSKYNDFILSRQLSEKYKGALVQVPKNELATLSKELSLEIRAKPLEKIKGVSQRATLPSSFQEYSFGKADPIFGPDVFIRGDELAALPNDFIAKSTIKRTSTFTPFSQPEMFFNPTLPAKQRAFKLETTETKYTLTRTEVLQDYLVPYVDYRNAPYYGGTRILQASTLDVSFSPIELSKSTDLAVLKKGGKQRGSKQKGGGYSVAGDFPTQPKYGIDLYQRTSTSIQPSLGKLFARYTAKQSGISFVKGFDLPKGYSQPLIIQSVKVRGKANTKSQTTAPPIEKGFKEVVLPSGLVVLQKLKTEKVQEQKQKVTFLKLKTQKVLGQRQKMGMVLKPLYTNTKKQSSKQLFTPLQASKQRQKQGQRQRQRSVSSFSLAQSTKQEQGVLMLPKLDVNLGIISIQKPKQDRKFKPALDIRTDTALRPNTPTIPRLDIGGPNIPFRENPPKTPRSFAWNWENKGSKKSKNILNTNTAFSGKYTASVGAVLFNVSGKRPRKEEYSSGLTLRPLALRKRRKRKRFRF